MEKKSVKIFHNWQICHMLFYFNNKKNYPSKFLQTVNPADIQ